MFLFATEREQAIREKRGGRSWEEVGKKIMWHVPFCSKREHAIRKLEGGARGAKDGEEKDKILLRDVHFHIF